MYFFAKYPLAVSKTNVNIKIFPLFVNKISLKYLSQFSVTWNISKNLHTSRLFSRLCFICHLALKNVSHTNDLAITMLSKKLYYTNGLSYHLYAAWRLTKFRILVTLLPLCLSTCVNLLHQWSFLPTCLSTACCLALNKISHTSDFATTVFSALSEKFYNCLLLGTEQILVILLSLCLSICGTTYCLV